MSGLHRAFTIVRRAIIVGLVAVGLLTVASVAVEVFSGVTLSVAGRLAPKLRAEPSQYAGQAWVRTYWREEVVVNRYDYQPYVAWRRHPFAGQTIVIDAAGIRRTTNNRCEKGALTVWMFGGSALWGSGSPDWGTIPSALAGILNQGEGRACVTNYGESAWVSSQESIKLILELKAGRRPDIAIFYDGWNDVSARYQTGELDAHPNMSDFRDKLERSPLRLALATTRAAALYDRVATGIGVRPLYLDRHRRPEPNVDVPASIRTQYLRNIDIVAALARDFDFDYAFFWQPMILAGGKPLTAEEERIKTESSGHPELTRVAIETYGLMRATRAQRFHFFGDVLKSYGPSAYLDWVHLDPGANRAVAVAMAQALPSLASGLRR